MNKRTRWRRWLWWWWWWRIRWCLWFSLIWQSRQLFSGLQSYVVISVRCSVESVGLKNQSLHAGGRRSQWRRGRGKGAIAPPPLNFSLSENYRPKIQNLGLKIPHFWENLGAKSNFWAPIISSVRNFENCNLLSPAPTFRFLTGDAADRSQDGDNEHGQVLCAVTIDPSLYGSI